MRKLKIVWQEIGTPRPDQFQRRENEMKAREIERKRSAGQKRAMQETQFLSALPGMRDSIRAGMKEPLSKAWKKFPWSAGGR